MGRYFAIAGLIACLMQGCTMPLLGKVDWFPKPGTPATELVKNWGDSLDCMRHQAGGATTWVCDYCWTPLGVLPGACNGFGIQYSVVVEGETVVSVYRVNYSSPNYR